MQGGGLGRAGAVGQDVFPWPWPPCEAARGERIRTVPGPTFMTQRAVLTGASEGIGRALARALARAGYRLTLVARNRQRLDSLLDELAGQGHEILVADLATTAGLDEAAAAVEKSRCHLLVNNAGAGAVGAFCEIDLEVQRALLRLNAEAVTVLSHVFLRQAEAGDVLLNVSSVVAFVPQPAQPLYSATKAFVTALTETLWQQVRDRGIDVIALHPGATETEFRRRASPDAKPRPRFLRQIPEEVAAVALRALHHRRGPHVISGVRNRILVRLARLLPRRWLLGLIGRFGR